MRTLAMVAGVTDRVWSVADIVGIMDVAELAPAKRGPYKSGRPEPLGFRAMVTLGGVVIVVALYWAEWFRLDFWFVVAAIINGALGTFRAYVDPDWNWRFRYKEGAEPDYPFIVLADKHRSAMIRLCTTKAVAFSIMAVIAWRIGIKPAIFQTEALLDVLPPCLHMTHALRWCHASDGRYPRRGG